MVSCDWSRTCAWASGAVSKRVRRDLHAQLIIIRELSRPTCRLLAVLRRLFGTPSVGTLLCHICFNKNGRSFVHTYLSPASSRGVNFLCCFRSTLARRGRCVTDIFREIGDTARVSQAKTSCVWTGHWRQ